MGKITYTNKVALNENPEIADINKVTDDDMNEIKSVVNTNDDNVGDITTLTTTDKTNVVNAINELQSNKALASDLGNIANLTTTDKTNTVVAINEVNSNMALSSEVGNIANLTTTDKSSIVNAINEVNTAVGLTVHDSYDTSTTEPYSANSIHNLHTYSTTEHRVGTWKDGKPVYAITLSGSVTATNLVIHNNSNIKLMVDAEGCVYTPDLCHNLGSYGSPNYYSLLQYNFNNHNISLFSAGYNVTGGGYDITIYYTKTTD